MKNIKYITLLIVTILFASCEEVIDMDLNTAPPRLVIDASINWVKGTDGHEQFVRLTTTTGYYEDVIPAVTGATVFITNSEGTVFDFIDDTATGWYRCGNFLPQIGENYTLTVIHDGQTYMATDKLYPAPDITRTEQDDEGGFLNEDIEVRFFYQDNGAEDNWYMYRFDSERMPYPDYDAIDDQFFQGNEMFGIFSHPDMDHGDILNISLYGISQRYYNYVEQLIEIAEGGAGSGPFQTVPANVRGNIINQTTESKYPLGYFRLGEVDTLDYTVQ